MTDQAIDELTPVVGIKHACAAVGRPRATHYRWHRQSPPPPRPRREPQPQPRALSVSERAEVLKVLHEKRFVDLAPGEVHAILLDEGRYLCSESTMYRLLRAEHGQVRERRRHAVHPPKVKPELVAHGANQCWSWDITKLHGPAKWTYYYLYSIIDIYSRYTVGWMVATKESKELAERLLADTIAKQNIDRDQLTIHADRGSSMASKPVAFLLADLGVTKSHSRPHCSNDNPFSESQFKTLKYRPDFPATFGSLQDARSFCASSTAGTTRTTATPGSGCIPPPTSTTATQLQCEKPAPPPCPRPTPPTPRGSSASTPNPWTCPAPPGSTDQRSRLNNRINKLTQQGDMLRIRRLGVRIPSGALCVETDDGPPTSGNAVGGLLVTGWWTLFGAQGDPKCRAGSCPGRSGREARDA